MKAYGGVVVQFHALLNSALDVVECSVSNIILGYSETFVWRTIYMQEIFELSGRDYF
jgi:hypothetical protein